MPETSQRTDLVDTNDKVPTLLDLGITRDQFSRWQRVAEVSGEEFEACIAEAMASYAKQARNTTLRKMADRIQARAIRRCGELLKQIEPAKPGPKPKLQEGAHQQLGRSSVAEEAGLSEHQRKTVSGAWRLPCGKRATPKQRLRKRWGFRLVR
jgi:hypothetical protein